MIFIKRVFLKSLYWSQWNNMCSSFSTEFWLQWSQILRSSGVLESYLNPGGGGGEVLKKVLYGKAPPRGPTLYLLIIYHFWQKMYPYHIPSLELCIAFTAVIALSLKCRWINHKPESFHSHKMHLLALLDPLFIDRNDRSPYPFIYFNKWNSHPFISLTWRLRKVPISRGASPYRPLQGVPPLGIKPQQVLTGNGTRMQ